MNRKRESERSQGNPSKIFKVQILFLLNMEPSPQSSLHTEARDNIMITEGLPHPHRFVTKLSQQEKVIWINAFYIHLPAKSILS